jgi:hypothetical protein
MGTHGSSFASPCRRALPRRAVRRRPAHLAAALQPSSAPRRHRSRGAASQPALGAAQKPPQSAIHGGQAWAQPSSLSVWL